MINEMMDRPVVMPDLVDFMRSELLPFDGILGELQAYANERRIPIIPHETAKFLDLLTAIKQPDCILELGTAIGFSALLMARNLTPAGRLQSIERNPDMYTRAEENILKAGRQDQIEILKGDAVDILQELPEHTYDLVFMDSAKAKYVEFLPRIMELTKQGGVIVIDDIFQGGTILEEEADRPRRVRKIHRNLNLLLDQVLEDTDNRSCLIPLGDGLLMILKEEP